MNDVVYLKSQANLIKLEKQALFANFAQEMVNHCPNCLKDWDSNHSKYHRQQWNRKLISHCKISIGHSMGIMFVSSPIVYTFF